MSSRRRRSGRLVVARHRSPRGRRVLPTLPLPRAGSPGEDGARHAARTSPVRLPVPAPVLRGVGIATAATVAVTGGAVALTGGAEAPPGPGLARDARAAAL